MTNVFILIISLLSFAASGTDEVPLSEKNLVIDKEIVPYFNFKNSKKNIYLKQIKFNHQLENSEAFSRRLQENLKEQLSGEGGDDVGNGGDDIRRVFLQMGNEIASVAYFQEFSPILDIRRVMVVDNLMVEDDHFTYNTDAIVAEGYIFLDRSAWSTNTGLLSGQKDPRFKIIELLFDASEVPSSLAEKLELYRTLSAFNSPVPPVCNIRVANNTIEFSTQNFSVDHEDFDEAQTQALKLCHQASLSDCHIQKFITKRTRKSKIYQLTASGLRASTRITTTKERQSSTCLQLQKCELVYDNMPAGQLQLNDAQALSSEIGDACKF